MVLPLDVVLEPTRLASMGEDRLHLVLLQGSPMGSPWVSGGLAMPVECEGAADGAVSDSASTAAVRLLFGAFGAAEGEQR